MGQEYVMEAVNRAILEQVVPKLFTQKQRNEWEAPYHEKSDHFNFAPLMTADMEFAALGGLAPQLAINDPRISQAQIDAAPKTLTVTLNGKQHTVPLRVYKNTSETVAEWTETIAFQARSREAISHLEIGLSREFNLEAGKDYSIGYGIGGVGDIKTANYFMQIFNAKTARKQGAEIRQYMQEQLAELTPERPSRIIVGGPIRIG